MLESIAVRNLGCFDDQLYQLDLNKLNVIVGPNNSGKSIIFKFLNMLKYNICDLDCFKSVTRTSNSKSSLGTTNKVSVHMSYYTDDLGHLDFKEISYNHKSEDIIVEIISNVGLTHLNINKEHMTIKRNYKKDITGWNRSTKNLFENIHYLKTNRKLISADITVRHSSSNDNLTAIKFIDSTGSNLVEFLHQRFSDYDYRYDEMLKWIKKIDPAISILKTPIINDKISIASHRSDGKNSDINVKLSIQGDGIQNALIIISTILFASKGKTVIIEEPEIHLHANSIEILIDLFNYAVSTLELQIIIITHSFEIINHYCSDVGEGTPRGNHHEKIESKDFKLITFADKLNESKIQEYDLKNKKYSDVRDHLKQLLK